MDGSLSGWHISYGSSPPSDTSMWMKQRGRGRGLKPLQMHFCLNYAGNLF